jgi:hypothetical protein
MLLKCCDKRLMSESLLLILMRESAKRAME